MARIKAWFNHLADEHEHDSEFVVMSAAAWLATHPAEVA